MQIEQSKLSSDDIAQMQKLIDGNENYRIRIQVPPVHPGAHAVAAECAQAQTKRSFRENVSRGARSRKQLASCWQSDVNDPSSEKVVASIPACLLAASNFHEIVRVHVDQYGHIRALWYQTMATGCPEGKPSLPAAPVQLVSLPMPRIPRLLLRCTHLPPGALVFLCADLAARLTAPVTHRR